MARPSVLTEDTVRKLVDAFKLDVTVEEACLYANISKDTYYRKLKEDEGFSDEIGRARQYATMAARLSVIKALPNDPNLALKYLERKRREEFAPHHQPAPELPHIDFAGEGAKLAEEFLKPPTVAFVTVEG